MPRRFALGLLALLVLLLLGLLVGRRIQDERQKERATARPTPTRTIPPPPTPIPARLVTIWFESAEDGLFHAEAREVPTAVDDVASLRSLASAVFEGPRHPSLLPPFPAGWTLRAAFRLAGGLAVLDLAPPAPPAPKPTPEPTAEAGKKARPTEPAPIAEPPKRWETGSSEELGAVQALVLTVTKNLPAVTSVILLVGGEPVETLAGHVDLTHPLLPDLSRVADAPPLVAPMPTPPTPAAPVEGAATPPPPTPDAGLTPAAAPSPSQSTAPKPRPTVPTPPSSKPAPAAAPTSVAPSPRPAARPTPIPPRNIDLT